MTWSDVENVSSKDAQRKQQEFRSNAADLARAYHRGFSGENGQRLIEDLTKRFIFNNDVSFGSNNINYEAAYKNGEAGVVKFIINQVTQAEIL
jgi:hypothetical protein|tara:strand:+ start:129 stop:407 length:279 start_codon:yes stop_codon:yes gene_type:complete